ncbi:hypothetical protein SLE2022_330920 [Rubroshorea leprosula]
MSSSQKVGEKGIDQVDELQISIIAHFNSPSHLLLGGCFKINHFFFTLTHFRLRTWGWNNGYRECPKWGDRVTGSRHIEKPGERWKRTRGDKQTH